MTVERKYVQIFEIEELACKITGLDYDSMDEDDNYASIIENKLMEVLEVDLETLRGIVERLLPIIGVGYSPLTKTGYKGFHDIDKKRWIIKTEIQ